MSPRFFSYPGSRPSGAEPQGADPERVDAASRQMHSEFFAERDRRRREEPDFFRSGFGPGDREVFQGEPVVVEHVEHDQHSGQETTWMRGEKSGTFQARWEKTSDGTAVIRDTKRTKD